MRREIKEMKENRVIIAPKSGENRILRFINVKECRTHDMTINNVSSTKINIPIHNSETSIWLCLQFCPPHRGFSYVTFPPPLIS